ncbi:hypothetical protein BCR34DRAFT_176562 [Clohesyomyces aquaticus]|uniref:Killer toxin Kp4 domain-containing protein n=1 Tax=Clohesyomyces aquaticus TaxID=1231657 RepID=A0A1Y1YFN7_9PLEO|nr:hypothetical protein BCR34DRAFT_176562 [Clohesyomyces aquaticus]
MISGTESHSSMAFFPEHPCSLALSIRFSTLEYCVDRSTISKLDSAEHPLILNTATLRMKLSIATTAAAILASFVGTTTANTDIGINCNLHSRHCKHSYHWQKMPLELLRDAIDTLPDDMTYAEGEYIACFLDYCAWPDSLPLALGNGYKPRVSAKEIKRVIRELLNYGCLRCGNVPMTYPSINADFRQVGQLKVQNIKHNQKKCKDVGGNKNQVIRLCKGKGEVLSQEKLKLVTPPIWEYLISGGCRGASPDWHPDYCKRGAVEVEGKRVVNGTAADEVEKDGVVDEMGVTVPLGWSA